MGKFKPSVFNQKELAQVTQAGWQLVGNCQTLGKMYILTQVNEWLWEVTCCRLMKVVVKNYTMQQQKLKGNCSGHPQFAWKTPTCCKHSPTFVLKQRQAQPKPQTEINKY